MYRSRLPRIALELRPVVDEAIGVAVERVAESARDRVPVDTGKLRDAIHTEDGYVIAGNTEVFYGHIVEHGSVRTPPRPFLVPALEENRAEAVALVSAALRGLAR